MKSLWSDAAARKLKGVEVLTYASNLIGQNPNLVLWGGGNSSLKEEGQDHTGKKVRILWIKGSGSDMKTMTAKQFTPLRLNELLPLFGRSDMSDDEMVAYQTKCSLEPSAPKASIETLLHAFVPAPHVYHTHADAVCAVTDSSDGRNVARKIFGKRLGMVPYFRPGFRLSKEVGEAVRQNPELEGIILDKHGLITWGNSAKEAYLKTIEFNTLAESWIRLRMRKKNILGRTRVNIRGGSPAAGRIGLPSLMSRIRGEVSGGKRMVLAIDRSSDAMRFVNSERAPRLSQIGPFTPDHLMHVKPKPLFLDPPSLWLDSGPRAGNYLARKFEKYRADYRSYFDRYNPGNVSMLDPNPRVILIPEVGMITTGKELKAANIVRDLYLHNMRVIRMATALGGFTFLSKREICDFEYWPMENFKLTLLPPEKEFSRHVVMVTGGSRGIGKAICSHFLREGAHVVLTDIDRGRMSLAAKEFENEIRSGALLVVPMDVTSPRSVDGAFDAAVKKYGGIDIVVSNAGYAKSSPVDRLELAEWKKSFAVNSTGHFLVSKRAIRLFKEQNIGGNLIFISTKNVLAPGKDFGAYSASKASESQLARILAIENGEFGIRVNMINPDGVFQDSGLWNRQVRSERARAHGIALKDVENFYAKRNLLNAKITPDDVARTALFLASSRSSKTTGAIVPVDGGIREAFPR